MFGWKRREWKHARAAEIDFLRELPMVLCLVALIFGVVTYYASGGSFRGGEPVPPPAPIEEASPVPPETDFFDSLDSFDGTDPLAHPEVFETVDRVPAIPLPAEPPEEELSVIVDKKTHRLLVMKGERRVREYRVAVGRKTGDKQRAGDLRTPEGTFVVQQIHNAAHWVHDFGDGKGVIEGAYGPLFIRLKTPPWNGIGIHGTHDPDSLGSNATEGCVRMRNEELLEFAEMVKIGMKVEIRP